jgi:hypothetical protein|tara:strand:- start:342 stop:476 length:135 start_codon:yes stop_codon:yes gene_type:complete
MSAKSLNITVQNDHLQRMAKAVQLIEPIASDAKIQKYRPNCYMF